MIAGLLGCPPGEVFKLLLAFNEKGFDNVLEVMELSPVSLMPECDDFSG
jgi:hypothetical protein